MAPDSAPALLPAPPLAPAGRPPDPPRAPDPVPEPGPALPPAPGLVAGSDSASTERDAVPVPGAGEDATRRTMRVSVVEGAVTQAFLNWTSGAVLTGYMLHLGAGPAELGLVASVPLLAQLASPFAAWAAGALGRRRLLVALTGAFGRGLWILAALLPALHVAPDARPALMVALVLVSSAFQASNGTLWAAWMGDVVPPRVRGRYFGFRAGVVGLVGTAANLAAGAFLDAVRAPLSFQVVLLVGVLCAAVGVALLFLQEDVPAPARRTGLAETLRAPLADPNFRRFLLFGAYWQFVVMLAAPFVLPYFLGGLGMDFLQVGIWSSIAAVTALLTTSAWGRIGDRYGAKPVLAIGTWLAGAALPATWILSGLTGDLRWIWVSAALDAVAWGAIGPAVFNLALATAPPAGRASFMAMYGLATGAAGFLGGALSGPLLLLLSGWEPVLPGGARWTGYHALFALSGLLRCQAWRLLRPVAETDSWRTRDVLRQTRVLWRATGFFWRR